MQWNGDCASFLHDYRLNVMVYKCIQCWLINIHPFDYPDSQLSGLFGPVPKGPDNRGWTAFDLGFSNKYCVYIHVKINIFV